MEAEEGARAGADRDFAKLSNASLERPPPMCWADVYSKPVVSLKGTSNATMVPWCVQSAVRNSLGLALCVLAADRTTGPS